MNALRNRLELAKLFSSLGYKRGAEVGVFAGYYSEKLCQANPGLELYSVDTWDDPHTKSAKVYEEAKARLKPYNVQVIRGASTTIAEDFEDGFFDFVYIDGAHDYDNVKADIEAWFPKVRTGGILSGDDYYITNHGNKGVVQAVNRFADANKLDLQVTLWDIDNPVEDDQQPAWWLMK